MSAEPALRPLAALPPARPFDPQADSTFGTPGDYNLIGIWTLYQKEVRRFFKVISQTLVAPVVSTLVFMAIFAIALGQGDHKIGDLPFLQFVAPGLIMMAVVQNAFSNTSSSLMIAKIQGNIVDYLMPPLAPGELLLGLVMGGVTRGVLVGVTVALTTLPFVPLPFTSPFLALFYLLAASVLSALLGVLAALWAVKFDQMAMVTNFVITPLSFLSGTFYSIAALPRGFHLAAILNPFFYMIDGLRYALTGHADGSIWAGVLTLLLVNLALGWLSLHLLRTGYRLKA